jgi:hypothetical protein
MEWKRRKAMMDGISEDGKVVGKRRGMHRAYSGLV